MKKNAWLVSLVGVPIGVCALFLSYASFMISWNWSSEARWMALLGVGGIWATFTGMRNLLRFQTAHLLLRWHDWVGGLFGFLANSVILWLFATEGWKVVKHFRLDREFWLHLALIPLALPPLICFGIVAFRFFKARKLSHE